VAAGPIVTIAFSPTFTYEPFDNIKLLLLAAIAGVGFSRFINEFKNNENLTITNVLDWNKIKEKYDGMVICPYLGNELWGPHANSMGFDGDAQAINEYVQKIAGDGWKDNILFLAEWYRHWETGSGVIWRDSGVKDFKLVERLTTFDNLNLEGFNQKSY